MKKRGVYATLETLAIGGARKIPHEKLERFALNHPDIFYFAGRQTLKLGLTFQKENVLGETQLSQVKQDKFTAGNSMLHQIHKRLEEARDSNRGLEAPILGLVHPFSTNVFVGGVQPRRNFYETYGYIPPLFLTISPTNDCNLRCVGCYANDPTKKKHLKALVFDRLITQSEDMGIRFFVISGGEPYMYRSQGMDLIDIIDRHPNSYFLTFTNGTMLNNENLVRRIARTRRITPAFSEEGLEKETDERRGPGTYKRIQRAKALCNKYGVIHGASLTLMEDNAEVLLSEEFLRRTFEEQKAAYAYIFHYMPIGRDPDPTKMPTAEQRVWSSDREWEFMKREKILIADFWNLPPLSDGCISAGRAGGYFYVLWDGSITPCVFMPFIAANLYDLYEEGKSAFEVLKTPLFVKLRGWQKAFAKNNGDWTMGCPIRDNAGDFYEIIRETGVQPLDEEALSYLNLCQPGGFMRKYNEECKSCLEPRWKSRYLKE